MAHDNNVFNTLKDIRVEGEDEGTEAKTPISTLVLLNCPTGDQNLLPLLWAKSASNICCDGAANALYEDQTTRLVPDVIIGDLDSLKSEIKALAVGQSTVIHDKCQDTTDLQKALSYVLNNKKTNPPASGTHELVVIYGAGGLKSRFDHVMSQISALYEFTPQFAALNIRLVLLFDHNLCELLLPGSHGLSPSRVFEGAGTHCGLIPFLPVQSISTTGLEWNMENQKSTFGGMMSTCNKLTGAEVTIKTSEPVIWTTSFGELTPI